MPVCALKEIGVAPWGPLASGLLTGKYPHLRSTLPGTRSQEGQGFDNRLAFLTPDSEGVIAEVRDVAGQIGRSVEDVALRWLLEQPQVTSVIIGARNVDQARENLAASRWRLPTELTCKLEEVSRPRPRYPRDSELGR